MPYRNDDRTFPLKPTNIGEPLRGQDLLYAPHAAACFKEIAVLGEGGMGRVVRIKDRRLGREAALKLLKNPADPEVIERFRGSKRLTRCGKALYRDLQVT